ncbi:hypothetical protein WOLCODRAFT_150890 [Wolfiporia cocos MD-104 SS10]|uniref:Uncharacterized protein n=1 Tax=Wolfiporia cocos (strain MD-104) TaxID=742152 RepID=A0A2H3JLX5_WOLCO|nr:hypothetical protein WOLCODRAFT_150890 [Wolfiporia cocos MD-104 SS10]
MSVVSSTMTFTDVLPDDASEDELFFRAILAIAAADEVRRGLVDAALMSGGYSPDAWHHSKLFELSLAAHGGRQTMEERVGGDPPSGKENLAGCVRREDETPMRA